jgi:4-hydroxybenzoate polyprenyltransferase
MEKTGKIIIFIVLLIGFLLLGIFLNGYFYAIGGLFAYLAIDYAYKHLFKKGSKDNNEIKLKKD